MLKKPIKFVLTVNATLHIKGNKVQFIVKDIKVKPSTLSLPIKVNSEQTTSKIATDWDKKMKLQAIQRKKDHEMINKTKLISAELTRPKSTIQFDKAIKQSQIERKKNHKMILDAHGVSSISDIPKKKRTRTKLGKSLHDIILESAKAVSKKADEGIFTTIDLFNAAVKKYPELKKNSFNTTVVSAAPEHKSWKYYKNGKDYLVYMGKGKYRLREKSE